MSIPLDTRALICTTLVMAAIAGAASARLPTGLDAPGGLDRQGVVPLGLGGEQREDERRKIVAQVLRFEARRRDRQDICLQRDASGPTFTFARRVLAGLRGQVGEHQAAARRTAVAAIADPVRVWRLPDPAERPRGGGSFAGGLGSQLGEAERLLLAAPEPESATLRIDRAEVPPPLRACDRPAATLRYSIPERIGDVAFVETHYDCGARCGEGWLYAVQRDALGWRLYGMTGSWTF